MNIEKQYQDDHSVKLIVEFDAEKTNAYKRRAAARISSRSKIPGFRPGKAPYEIVVRNFGEGAIAEQAIDLLIDDEYSKILTEAEINPGAAGALESVDNLDPFKMTFHVPLAPEVDLGDYRAVRLSYEWQAPGEKEVEEALENLRQMYSTTETVEREIQAGDYVLLDMESETTELNRKGFATFVRNEERDGEQPYNGFAKELIGLKPGESKTVTHIFPEDWDIEELKGKSVEIKVTIKTVRGVTLPDLDDELAKMTGAGDTLDALREAVKKDVEARSKDEYDDKYFVDLIEKIKEGATIKYHARALEHESEHILSDLSSRLAQQNMDLETYFKIRNTTREKFIEEEVNPIAKKRLERSLILDEIIRRENIEADNASLESEYNNTMLNLMQQGVDLSKARGGRQGLRQISQAIAMESISRVVTRKALDTLKAIATGEYKPVEESTQEKTPAAEESKQEESGAESAGGQEKTAE